MSNSHDLKKLQYDGKDIVSEVAVRDDQGRVISSTYVDKITNQSIDGYKNFVNVPTVNKAGDPVGKNLFNPKYLNQSYWMGSYVGPSIYVGPNEYATISYKGTLAEGLGFYFVISGLASQETGANGTWLYHSQASYLIKNVATVQADENGYIYFKNAGTFSALKTNILEQEFQVELGQTKTEYEPYISPVENLARISDIPTNVSQLSNDSGYITSSDLPTDYVDLTSNQVVDGQKDFNTIPRVKIAGEQPREGLPDAYTQLQYVESDGSQYIDTTYAINTATDTVEMVFECTGTTIYKWLFGEHDNNARFGLGVGDGTNRRNVAYGATTYKVNDSLFYDSLHYFKADSAGVFIDDTKVANYSSFSSTSSLALFDLNNNGFGNGTAAKIQSYKHTRNNIALIDLVPVIRNSDDKAGFYDFVSESFIGSTNNVELSPGPELPGPRYEVLLTDANVPSMTSQLINDSGFITASYHDSTKANQSSLDAVTAKIPTEASSSNQLADKAFVNSSITTATAMFRGTYTTLQDLQATSGDLNDYAFYNHTDEVGNTVFDRYKYTDDTPHWAYEYTLNNSSFTAAQWAAINSGVSADAWVNTSSAQVIDGQKDFNTIPRVKVEHTIHNLPDTYQEVEYLESTGTQYIDTGVILTNLHAVEIDYQLTSTQQTNRRGLYGILSTNAASRFGSLFSPTNYQLEHGYGVTNVYWQQGLPNANRHLLKQDKNITYMDGVVVHTFNEATFTTTGNALLGNFNYTNYIPALAKYYESKWWNDDVLIRDFIPCYRKSDDKPGYYDIVNNTFYTNVGTDDFVVGPNVEPITYESLLTDANFSPVAFSGNYNELINKPTIPTVNNGTLTIQRNGTTVTTFDANQSASSTANITVPTKTSELVNDSGFITSSDIPAITTLLQSISGYDATKTQTLKNINGIFTWVDD